MSLVKVDLMVLVMMNINSDIMLHSVDILNKLATKKKKKWLM